MISHNSLTYTPIEPPVDYRAYAKKRGTQWFGYYYMFSATAKAVCYDGTEKPVPFPNEAIAVQQAANVLTAYSKNKTRGYNSGTIGSRKDAKAELAKVFGGNVNATSS